MNNSAITYSQIRIMLNLQDSINSIIDMDWREKGHPWFRAIWTECAEMLDHVGWKWWKYTEKNIDQVHLEIIDIWHFALSEMLLEDEMESLCESISSAFEKCTEWNEEYDVENLRAGIEAFAAHTLLNKKFSIELFVKIMIQSGLKPLELFKMYVGKNILNKFRQDNGYKTGEYIKIWEGQEDNVWLSEILEKTSPTNSNYEVEIYDKLMNQYKKITNKSDI